MRGPLGCAAAFGVVLGCGGTADPAVPSRGASASVEPIRTYAYPCKAKVKPVQWFRLTPDERMMLTAGGSDPIELEDGATIELPASLEAWDLSRGVHQFTISTGLSVYEVEGLLVAFDPSGRFALSPGAQTTSRASNTTPKVWDLQTGATTVLGASMPLPTSVTVSGDGKIAAMVGTNALLTIELGEPKVLKRVDDPDYGPGSLRFSSDQRVLFMRDSRFRLIRYDARSLEVLDTFETFGAVSSNGSLFVGGSSAGAGLFEANTGKKVHDLPISSASPYLLEVSFSPDDTRLVILTTERLYAFDVATGEALAEVPFAGGSGLAWSGDGQALLTGLTLWNAKSWSPTQLRETHQMRPSAGHLVDKVDGETLVEIDALTLVPTGRTYELKGHGGSLTPYRFTHDHSRIVYLNHADNTVRFLRTSDHAIVDLGVAVVDGAPHGFVATPEGSYEGPEAAAGCAPKTARGRRMVSGLMKRFLAGEPVD